MKNEKLTTAVRWYMTTLKGSIGMLCAAFLISHFSFLISGCARMGNPDGGWYDDDPPRIIGSVPAEQGINVTTQKIVIQFDEYIKLENPTQNVIVSPPQLEVPEIEAKGKKIVVELLDSLKPNTTYTIDFSDAISDNNEGNPLGNYTFTFSTGERIDTFEVAGYVLDASNLEPVQGISVGLYDNLADSVFRKEPLMRISRTDESGHFVVKGVAPGEYRVYALKDADGDFRFSQKSEMIAFSHNTYKPTAGPDVRQDTIWRDTLHIDNIIRVPFTHFYPDDIMMLAFQEEQTDRFLLKNERANPDRLTFYFSYGHPQLPVINGLNFDSHNAFVAETSLKKDTLTYWLRDTTLINKDTLDITFQYMMSDSSGVLVSHTDTLSMAVKTSYEKRLKERSKEYEDWRKEQEKKKKRDEPYDSIYPVKYLNVAVNIPSAMTPVSRVSIVSPTPLAKLDTAAIHLYSKVDSLWYRSPFDFHRCDSMLRHYELIAQWKPEVEYSLEIDSAAFTDIYGLSSDAVKMGIKLKPLSEFATLAMQLSGVRDTGIVVQLLNGTDKCLQQTRASATGLAEFFYLQPGSYYIRAFVDRNGNDKWDTGDFDADYQPEDMYYYPQEVECKAKWDITLPWNVNEKPRNKQKPGILSKAAPGGRQRKKLQNRNAQRAKDLGIEYVKKTMVK